MKKHYFINGVEHNKKSFFENMEKDCAIHYEKHKEEIEEYVKLKEWEKTVDSEGLLGWNSRNITLYINDKSYSIHWGKNNGK